MTLPVSADDWFIAAHGVGGYARDISSGGIQRPQQEWGLYQATYERVDCPILA